MLTPYWHIICKFLLPFSRLSFHFVNVFVCCVKTFNLKQWKQWLTLFFWVPKITAVVDCSHEIKRSLLFERKFMTNLDSILKSRDITFPTKVHLVKAMVSPVVMFGCESWTVKKAEH